MTEPGKADQRARRKDDLADAAIEVLKQLGYAQTGLRDIAGQCGVAVGTLHYHFADKAALMDHCVRRYKAGFLAAMAAILDAGLPEDRLLAGLIDRLTQAIRLDAQTHRLWYDIRTQAMFDRRFEAVVAGIEADLIALVSRLLARLGLPREQALTVYLQLDACFRYHLQRHLAGDAHAAEGFRSQIKAQVSHLLALRR
jgi:AcrR family transcriptional regulator